MKEVAKNINILGAFCGRRDVEQLTESCLNEAYGIKQADVMVLFGGSIFAGGDVLAQAMKDGIAKKYVIVGGAGHTTETFRKRVHDEYPEIITEGLPEAEVFQKYLQHVYHLEADYLETQSTNCGNNITYLLELLKEQKIECQSIILSQDATMQLRMDAGMRKYAPEMTIINYATYKAEVVTDGLNLVYKEKIKGMWDVERYINLLMGEIPRLFDDENGYGPNGKDFIAHTNVPPEVIDAFMQLEKKYSQLVREANPLYASK